MTKTSTATKTTTEAASKIAVVELPVKGVHPDPGNPRKTIRDLDELVASVKEVGVLNPILVVPDAETEGDYRIVCGERRWRAAKRARLTTIPALVKAMTEKEIREAQVVENDHRDDLTPIEEAAGYLRLVELPDYTIRRIATLVKKPQARVRERLALLELPKTAQEAIEAGDVSLEDAKVLVKAKSRPDLIEAAVDESPRNVAWALRQKVADTLRKEHAAALVAECEAEGIRVVEDEGHDPKGYALLSTLGIDAEAHANEPCHAVVIRLRREDAEARGVCTEKRRHTARCKATDRSPLQVERPPKPEHPVDEAEAKRKAAKGRRQEFVDVAVGRRVPRGAALAFLVATVIENANTNAAAWACRRLGIDPMDQEQGKDWLPALRAFAEGGETPALRVAVALAAFGAETSVRHETAWQAHPRAYLDFLIALGYEPDRSERVAVKEGLAKEKKRRRAAGTGSRAT